MLSRHQKKIKLAHEQLDATARVFASADVSMKIMSFMDVPSLVRFGSTNKIQHQSFKNEVKYRKARFLEIKNEIGALLMTENDSGHVKRVNLERAISLRDEATGLIDSGLGWLSRHQISWRFHRVDGEPTVVCLCNRDRLFQAERKQLKLHDGSELAEQLMLPSIFYCGPFDTEGLDAPAEDEYNRVLWVWGAEDHMENVYQWTMFTPIQDPNFPLRRFEVSMAQGFCELIHEHAGRYIGDIHAIESFRVAARNFVKAGPNSMPCLNFALTTMDELALEYGHEAASWEEEE